MSNRPRFSHRRFIATGAAAVACAMALAVPGSAATEGAVSVAPYVDMGQSPTPSLSAMATGGGLKSFTLGFVISVGCKASWFNAHDPASKWQSEEIGKIRAAGGDVKVSFGGAAGIELAQDCPTADATAAQYNAVIDAYQLDYIDLDIEGAASADPVSVDRRSTALAKVQQQHPGLKVSLTLPVLPTGLTGDGMNVLTSAHKAGVAVDLVNVMAMDYGAANADMGHAATQAAQATQKQVKSVFGVDDATAWRMIGVTPMLGVNDSAGETFSQQDAHTLVDYANQVHLGMLSFWEEGRDANACNGSLSKCTNIPQKPYEFSKIFGSFTG
jgi:chitinase